MLQFLYILFAVNEQLECIRPRRLNNRDGLRFFRAGAGG